MWAGADVIGPFSINVGPKLQISRRSDSSRKVIAARLLLIRAGRNASINPAGRRYALKLPSPTRRKRRAILNRLDASSCTHRPSRSAENDFGGGRHLTKGKIQRVITVARYSGEKRLLSVFDCFLRTLDGVQFTHLAPIKRTLFFRNQDFGPLKSRF